MVAVLPMRRPQNSGLMRSRSEISWCVRTIPIRLERARSRKLMKSSPARSENSSMITVKGFRLHFGISASIFAETALRSSMKKRPITFAVSPGRLCFGGTSLGSRSNLLSRVFERDRVGERCEFWRIGAVQCAVEEAHADAEFDGVASDDDAIHSRLFK